MEITGIHSIDNNNLKENRKKKRKRDKGLTGQTEN